MNAGGRLLRRLTANSLRTHCESSPILTEHPPCKPINAAPLRFAPVNSSTYYSATQLSRLFTRLFTQAGIEGASAKSGRRTLAVKFKRQGIDLRHISEILGIDSLEAVKRLCAGDPARLGDIVRRII